MPSSRLCDGVRMINDGIRYSNMDPDQDTNAPPSSIGTIGRPNRNQCATGTSPLAMAMKLVSLASEASRS